MSLISTIKFIYSHPLNRKNKIKSIIRFFKWQINTTLIQYPIIYSFTEKTKLIVKKGMTGATGNLYCGLHEYKDMLFLLHFLREEDLFVDIGANIGSYTILASGHIGAKTIAIEPVPSTFEHIIDNININRINDRVTAINIALGSEKGFVNFTKTLDTINHVACENENHDTIRIPIETLDNILSEKEVPVLLKIDVEGYETNVIKGAYKTLQKESLKAIIIELNGSGSRYGYNERDIHNTLKDFDFRPSTYDPVNREIIIVNDFGANNTIYVKDLGFVKNRVENASKISIIDNTINI